MELVYVEDWGSCPYAEAWDRQTTIHKALVEHKLAHRKNPADNFDQEHKLILVEHPPVYTLGKSGSSDHLLLSESECREQGIEYFPINRGGDITFHGPGQLVVYPILDLDLFFNDVHRYVRNLEEIVIRTMREYGLEGMRIKDYTGVWLEGDEQYRKICAIGVHLSRWVTLHGLAFNINTDLSFFKNIIPCGIDDDNKSVTSLSRELGHAVQLDEVKQKVVHHFTEVFDCKAIIHNANNIIHT